jgi:2-oxoglutarate dehydrogenase E1 component
MLWEDYFDATWLDPYESAISKKQIKDLNKKLQKVPSHFEIHPRVKKMMSERQKMADGKINADWGFAETLSYASLTDFGTPIRLTGQDTGRGTFFHRNAVLHNQLANEDYTPLQNISDKQGRVQIFDSILSERRPLDLSTVTPLRTLSHWLFGKLSLETLLMALKRLLINLLPRLRPNGGAYLT